MSSDGLPDIIADFSSHVMLGLDDDAIEMAILDDFAFDAGSNTFSLLRDFLLFDAAITTQTAGGAFQQAFTLAYMTSGSIGGDSPQGSYQQQYAYDGSGRQRLMAQVPSSLLLLLGYLPLVARLQRNRS